MATGNQQITQSSQAWTESPYKFTQPVRVFKANDPYYWEVDNIPIQQLEENILWLKDQIATSTFVSGVGRSDLAELRPFANGASRTVYVQPGRYTARINDAYGKGIGTKTLVKRAISATLEREEITFTYTDEEMRAVLGDSIDTVFLNNGLYDHLQHHNAEPTSPNTFLIDWRHGYTYFTQNTKGVAVIQNIPKNKLALWKKVSKWIGKVEGSTTDLQQMATDFTRVYGGAIRTSVVNIPEQLDIQIPEFDVEEHRVGTTSQPQVRVDLLFVYSHPIDADSTTIPSPNGTAPTQIYAPRLGLLKGAGVFSVSAVNGGSVTDLTDVSGFVDGAVYQENAHSDAFRLDMGPGVNEDGTYVTNAVAGDQVQTQAGLNNVYGSFPSPDDVMNLAPLFAEYVESGDNQYSLVGQSILPLAYVFVKRGKALIEEADVVDIRPFFRTTELAYNERAGVAAANPPLSFANPAVGKMELRDTSYKVQRDMLNRTTPLISDVNSLKSYGHTLAKGMIFGGTKWGVEGGHLAFMNAYGLFPTQTEQDALEGLKQFSHVPPNITSLPLYPGWDINERQLQGAPGGSLGSRRNDRLHSSVMWGERGTWQRVSPATQLPQSIYEDLNDPFEDPRQFVIQGPYTRHSGQNTYMLVTTGALFVKKDIEFPPGFLDGFSDYDVEARMIGAVTMTNATAHGHIDGVGATFNGITVQKRGRNGVTIIVSLGHPSGSDNNPWFGKPDDWTRTVEYHDGGYPGLERTASAENYVRDNGVFSRVMPLCREMVLNDVQHISTGTDGRDEGGMTYLNQGGYLREWEVYSPMLVTYPTVEFTITGYQGTEQTTSYFSTNGTNPSNSTLNYPTSNA